MMAEDRGVNNDGFYFSQSTMNITEVAKRIFMIKMSVLNHQKNELDLRRCLLADNESIV